MLALIEGACVTIDAMPRILAVISAITCILVCASCTTGSHSSPLPPVSTTNLPAPTSPVEPSGVPTCGSPSGPQAWAEDVSAGGRVLWRTALTTESQVDGYVVQPVTASGIVVFADNTSVYGLRLSDGRLLWRTLIGQTAQNMWTSSSTVTVSTGPTVSGMTLVSLDLSSGRKRWEYRFSRADEPEALAQTGDGGVATITSEGDLMVRSLDTGHVRWTVPRASAYLAPATAGSLVFASDGGQLRGYDAETGSVVWSVGGMPPTPQLGLLGGILLVSGSGPHATSEVTALAPATGRVLWRLNPGSPADFTSSGPAGLGMETGTGNQRLALVSQRNGRVQWQAQTTTQDAIFSVITASDVAYAVNGTSTAQIVDRQASDGAVRWESRPLTGEASPPSELTGNSVLVVIGTDLLAFSLASGAPEWRLTLPGQDPVTAPLVTASGVLVEPGNDYNDCVPPKSGG
jgi:outer membrane protein assembly factor BamB